ncbi:hypothetical protein BegalDRAFT_1329 [Beggiatoa alba B18LD]|uniref:Uncharacterized protein n=1 Tax=Beggiatoa alba B18LD TaxID=395493 RepID=I3CF32_9GAMM|nr:hypothetical protein [Beggiatoa alba]EIJ42225.1 hypothetical protein BegalDRAFT_1329 [Beggiatoa alba B18LD]
MRCPNCNHSQRFKDGLTCQKCAYQFALSPKTDGISDYVMRQLIQHLSGNGQFVFTKNQLSAGLAQFLRRRYPNLVGCGGCLLMLLFLFSFAIPAFLRPYLPAQFLVPPLQYLLILIPISFLAPIILYARLTKESRERYTKVPNQRINQIIEKYKHKYSSELDKLITDGKAFLLPQATEKNLNLDKNTLVDAVGLHYAPERILVVERDDIVDMLIRNRFHLQSKTAVVSQSGYPTHVFAACKHFVRKQANLPVYVAHDASLFSFQLVERLRKDPRWQFAKERLQDIGFSRELVNNPSCKLGWTSPLANKETIFTKEGEEMLRQGMRIYLDAVPPNALNNILGTAVLTGAMLLLPAIWSEGHAGSDDTGGDDFG